MKYFACLLALVWASLFSEEQQGWMPSVEGVMPCATVEGLIDSLRGELYFDREEFAFRGVERLAFRRFFGTRKLKAKDRTDGLYFPLRLSDVNLSKNGMTLNWHYREGASLRFHSLKKNRIFELKVKEDPREFSNLTFGIPSGKTDPINFRMICEDWDSKEGRGIFHLFKGDGSKLCYRHFEERNYLLFEEYLPSGAMREYSYDDEGRLVSIRILSSGVELGRLDISREDDVLFVQASTGAWVRYTEVDREVLIESWDKPDVRLKYVHYANHTDEQISHIYYSDDRYVKRKGSAIVVPPSPGEKPVEILSLKAGGVVKYKSGFSARYKSPVLARIGEIHRMSGDKYGWTEVYKWDVHRLVKKTIKYKNDEYESVLYRYDKSGNIIEEILNNGFTIKNDYDEKNRLVGTVDSSSGQRFFSYVGDTHLLASEEGPGYRKTYRYNVHGMRTEELEETAYTRQILRHDYHVGGVLNALPKSLWKGYGPELQLERRIYEYDECGRVVCEQVYDANDTFAYALTWDYDEKGRVIGKTDALGQVTVYAYDELGNCIFEDNGTPSHRKFDHFGRMIFQESGGILEHFEYDIRGNCIKKVDRYGNETTYEYNSYNCMTKETFPDGNYWKWTYYKRGGVKTKKSSWNALTKYDYDDNGNEICCRYPDGSKVYKTYYPSGLLETETGPDGRLTRYSYDVAGNLISEREESSCAILKERHWRYVGGLLVSEIDAMDHLVEYDYDKAGRKVRMRSSFGEVEYGYDALGRLCFEDNGEYIKRWAYDLLDRVVESWVETPDGRLQSRQTTSYDRMGREVERAVWQDPETVAVTHTDYDDEGLPICITDPEGNVTRIVHYHGECYCRETIDPLGLHTFETHDNMGRLVSRLIQGKSEARYQYDRAGRIEEESYRVFDRQGPLEDFVLTNSYDKMGRVLSRTENGVRKTEYAYDIAGRLSEVKKPSGIRLFYEYDALGHILRLRSSDGTVDEFYTYNALGQLEYSRGSVELSRKWNAAGKVASETVDGFCTEYTYDSLGRVLELCFPDGSVMQYDYDGMHLVGLSRASVQARVQRNFLGAPVEVDLPGARVRYHRDLLGQVLEINSENFQQFLVSYDAVGNPSAQKGRDPHGEFHWDYTYDDLHRLASEEGTTSHQYHLDSLSNRREVDGVPCEVSAHNELVRQGELELEYDEDGRVTAYGDTHFFYDAKDRLIRVDSPIGVVDYAYDTESRRVRRGDESYILHDCNEIGVHVGGEIRTLRSGVFLEFDGEMYVPIQNHRGDWVLLQDLNGTVVESHRYDAYGEIDPHGFSPYRYGANRMDPLTGFVSFTYRDYMPDLGAWLEPDPIGYDDGPNRYAYVHGRPITHADPFGLSTDGIFATDSFGAFLRAEGPPLSMTFQQIDEIYKDACNTTLRWSVTDYGKTETGESLYLCTGQLPSGNCVFCLHGAQKEGIEVLYVNGIRTKEESHVEQLVNLHKYSGGNRIWGFFAPTVGLSTDYGECVKMTGRDGAKNPIVLEQAPLMQYLTSDVVGDNGKLLVFAHSRGAVQTDRAVSRLSKDSALKIFLNTLGSPARVSYVGKGNAVNWYNEGDSVENTMIIYSNLFRGDWEFDRRNTKTPPKFGFVGVNHYITTEGYQKIMRDKTQEKFNKRGF